MTNDFNKPLSRVEAILQNMLGGENDLDIPKSRIEKLLLLLLDKVSEGSEEDFQQESVSGSGSISKTLESGKTYCFGGINISELNLTLDSSENGNEHYRFLFSTASGVIPILNFSPTVIFPNEISLLTDKLYEIDIIKTNPFEFKRDGFYLGLISSWDIPSTGGVR